MAVEDRRKVAIRLSILQYVVIVLFSVLAVSFWVLQVVQHAKFEEMAENNHQRTLPLRAPRGIVFDRDSRCWSRTASPTAFRSFASTRRT